MAVAKPQEVYLVSLTSGVQSSAQLEIELAHKMVALSNSDKTVNDFEKTGKDIEFI